VEVTFRGNKTIFTKSIYTGRIARVPLAIAAPSAATPTSAR
jgi:hypothetical protein